MEPLVAIVTAVSGVLDRFWPDKTQTGLAQLDLMKVELSAKLQEDLAKMNLLKGQLDVDKAEAANQNRTWITWRELLGYGLACGAIYSVVIQPILVFIAALCGHPVVALPKLELNQLISLLTSMLGVAS